MIRLSLFIFLFGCSSPESPVRSPGKPTDSEVKTLFGHLYVVDSSDIAIIPVAIESDFSDDNDRGSGLGSYSKSGGSGSRFFETVAFRSPINNLIFYNETTKKSHLLGNRKYYITEVDILKIKTRRSLLLEMITQDLNDDKRMTSRGLQSLFLANVDSSSLRQITPQNESLWNWRTDKNDGILYIETKIDSNGDKQFTNDDRTVYYRLNWQDETLESIVPEDLYKQAKGIIE